MASAKFFLAAVLLLSGCTGGQRFDAIQRDVRASPALRQERIENCVRNTRMTPENRRTGAALMNVSPDSDVERIGCTRMIAAIASGKLSRDSFSLPTRITPELVRALQNR